MGFSNLLAFVISELYFVFLMCFHFEVLTSLYACHQNSCFSHHSPRMAMKKILYIYTLVYLQDREGVVHAHVCLREREKTKVGVDLSICFRVVTESCHGEELIALQNLSLGTVKVRTVYWEQGSFLCFFLSTLRHALCEVCPCEVCI